MTLDIDKKSILEELLKSQETETPKANETEEKAESCTQCGAPKSAWVEKE